MRQELEQAAVEAAALPPPPAWTADLDASPRPAAGVPAAAWSPAAAPVEMEVGEDSLKGLSVCFTGGSICSIDGVRLSREDQEWLARKAGLEVRQSVSARLDILVLANPESQSTKAQRAAELGVRRIAEPAFWRMAGVEVDGAPES